MKATIYAKATNMILSMQDALQNNNRIEFMSAMNTQPGINNIIVGLDHDATISNAMIKLMQEAIHKWIQV